MRQVDARHPGWVQGWAVVKGDWPNREFGAIYESRDEAHSEAARRGRGWEVRWGNYNSELDDFVSGDNP